MSTDDKETVTDQNSNNTSEELTIENSALKELLDENRKAMDALKSELVEAKKTNAKLLNSLNVEPQKKSCEELLNKNFNKYIRKEN